MSEETESDTGATTAANVQRLNAGYFEHMQSLRDQIPVGEYLVESETNRLALLAIFGSSLVMLVLFPLTMFQSFTPVVTAVWLVAFVVFGKIFYDRVMVPNEAAGDWEDG